MVEFPPFVFILADFVPKDNEDAIENRESAYHYIVEGDLVLECNKIGIHPITELVQEKIFSNLVDEAQLCEKVIEVLGADHFSPNKEVHDQFPLLEDYQEKIIKEPKEDEVIYNELWLFGSKWSFSQVLHTT